MLDDIHSQPASLDQLQERMKNPTVQQEELLEHEGRTGQRSATSAPLMAHDVIEISSEARAVAAAEEALKADEQRRETRPVEEVAESEKDAAGSDER